MCYYDHTLWRCGYWRWGTFREQCHKEHRTGETCGLKLVFQTITVAEYCKTCEQIGKKQRRMAKMLDDVTRWTREGNRRATIEKTQGEIADLGMQIDELWRAHEERKNNISY